MGLVTLALGLALLIGPHAWASRPSARARLAARLGEGPYKLGFTVVTLLGVVLIAYGFGWYRRAEWIDLWTPPAWTRHLAVALMWPAVILIVAAYMPGRIKRRVGHPMLAGVALWAAAHLIANGDLGSLLLFGSILVWALLTRTVLRRRDMANPHGLHAAPGRSWANDLGAVAVGTLAYLALGFTFHPLLIGVPAFVP